MARSLLELGSVELLELGAFQPKSWSPQARWNRVSPAYGQHNVRNVPGVTTKTPVALPTVTAPAYGALCTPEKSYWHALAHLARSRAQQLHYNTTWRPHGEANVDKAAALLAKDRRLLAPLVAAARAVAILAQHGVVDKATAGVREVVAKAMAGLPAADQAALLAAADSEIKKLAAQFNQTESAEGDLAATKLAAVAVEVFNPHDMTPWERLRLQGVVGGDLDAWGDYVELSADMFIADALGAALGKNFLKTFVKKVGTFVKKAAKKIIPAIATVAGAYTGNQTLISYGVQGLFSSQIKGAQKKQEEAANAAFQQQLQQQAVLQQAAVTTAVGAETLQNMGVQLPPSIQGIVQGVNAAVPASDPLRAGAKADIQATAPGNTSLAAALSATGPGGVPLWGYLLGGGALLVAGGVMIVALAGDGGGRKGRKGK